MRNKIALFGILAFIICSVSVGFVVTPVSAQNVWPMFHHDPQHTGLSPYPGPDAASLKWNYPTADEVGSSPIVGSDGTIYIGSTDKKLYALNPDGTLRWDYFTTAYGAISSSPAIDPGGTIYVGTDERRAGYDNFFAFAPTGPPPLWSIRLPDCTFISCPVVRDDGAYIFVGNNDGNLYAIDLNAHSWESCAITPGLALLSSPAIGPDGTIYIGAMATGSLYAITKPEDGFTWKWPVPLPIDGPGEFIGSSPAIGPDGTIYIGSSGYKLYAIIDQGTSGRIKWYYETSKCVGSSPAVANIDGDALIEVVVGSNDEKVHCIEDRGDVGNNPVPTAWVQWTFSTNGWVASSPAIDTNGVTYVGSKDGRVYAIENNGILKWKYPPAGDDPWGEIGSSPAIGPDGELYVGSADNIVYAIANLEDVFIRDCDDDDGRIPSWDANHNGIWDGIPPDRAYWVSPDIKVDVNLNAIPGEPGEENPKRGQRNDLYAYVQNIGSMDATTVVVKFYWADYSVGNPSWSSDFTHIDDCTISTIAPGATESCSVIWDPPDWTIIPKHTCIWIRLECDTDPIVSDDPGWENNIGWKNFYIEPSKGTPVGDYRVTVDFKVRNPDDEVKDVWLDLYLEDWPYNWTVELTSDDPRFHPSYPCMNFYIFSSMNPEEVGDVTLNVIAPAGTENDTGTIHIAGTIDNRPIGGVSVQVVPPEYVPAPDLVIEKSVTIEDCNFTVNYTVTNIGNGAAGPSTTCKLVDGTILETQPCPALSPGASYRSTFDPEPCSCGETLNVTVCADNYDDVTESDETNNCEVNFVECPLKSDLVITEKRVCWPDNCTICYNVTNIGTGTAPACHNTTLYVDGVEVAHDHVSEDLAPGESHTGCFNSYVWGYTPPSDNITVCADNNETIDELDEDNNCLTNIWMCGDVNCDGKVTMSDVRKVFNRYLDPNYPLDLPWAADVNCDGKVTMSDVRKVFNRYLDPGYDLNCCCEVL